MTLAESFSQIELISMDSALVYRGMDIGTAKPTREERQRVPHHLLDLIDPTESYSAARFIQDATQAAQSIRSRGKVPVVVGGTMLYYKAYRHGLDDLPSAPMALREQIAEEAQAMGWPALHQQLAAIDPQTAGRLNPNDAQRISRALELYRFTGKTMAALIQDSSQKRLHARDAADRVTDCGSDHEPDHEPDREPLITIALLPEDRAQLHARIAERFHAMLKAGFLDEVEHLKARGDLHLQLPSMRCVEAFVDAGIAATRQLAKRQITWLRSFTGIQCVDPFALSVKELSSALGQQFAAELHPSDRPAHPVR
jgi:tRNA dimethylallyltransferase